MIDKAYKLAGIYYNYSSKEVQVLRQSLLPPVICTAAAKGDINALDSLRQQVLYVMGIMVYG